LLKEFKKFILQGNVFDVAVGIIIGTAFTSIVNSLVNDILMPPIGLILNRVDFANLFINLTGGTYATLADAQAAGAVTLNYGLFIARVINFLILVLVVFLLVKQINRLKAKPEAAEGMTKDCPFCQTSIPVKATRCPHCTSQL
jgi:large conductance mechanosensitive channel